jgi:mercuric ion binding protein
MRSILALVTALLLPLGTQAATPRTAVLDVQNMTCSLCPVTVKKSLQAVPGVKDASIDFDKKTATVTFDSDKTTPSALVKATTDAGYPSAARK